LSKKETGNTPKQSKIPLYASLIVVLALVVGYFFVPDVQKFLDEAWAVLTSEDEKKIKNWVSDFGWFGPVVLVLLMTVQMFLLVIPTILLMMVSIIAYGPVWGSIIVLTGIFIASSIGYVIGKYVGELLVLKLIGEKTEKKMEGFLEEYGFWAIVVTRINPFLSNDSISFVAGVLKMNYGKFISATLIGIAPLTFFIAQLGNDTDKLKTGLFWASIVSLIVFAAYIWWDKKCNDSK
jgi:uncharacterized membrane protein YdjX (TVP38/TMEM64 family)